MGNLRGSSTLLWSKMGNQSHGVTKLDLALPLLLLSLFFHSSLPEVIFEERFEAALPRNETDKLALLAIKASIIHDPLHIPSSWNESLHFCKWQGVSCSARHQRVIGLNLSSQQLTGSISASIGNLSFLRIFDISHNNFKGEIPREISHLHRLEALILTNNSLKGELPSNVSKFQNMKIFQASRNELSGKLPIGLDYSLKLEELNLDKNNLEGNIPQSLGNISSLKVLQLGENHLEGHIPASLGRLKNLIILRLIENNLSGQIPESIYNLSYLIRINIAMNKFQGRLPLNLGLNFPYLRRFNVFDNHFSGPIPFSLSNASNLELLDLSTNNFSGGVPAIFMNLKKLTFLSIVSTDLGTGNANDLGFINSMTNCSILRVLYLDDCNFGGELPNSMVNLSSQLEYFQAAGNKLSGQIPRDIGNLAGLKAISFHHNQLVGTIPTSIGKLYKLQELGFGSNGLSGEIPSTFGNLTLLNSLWLEENNFNGSIPSSLGNCQVLGLLHLYSNSLSGLIPREIMSLKSLSLSLNLSRNKLTGSLPSEVSNLKSLVELDVSRNQLSDKIPSSLGDCINLVRLYINHNLFAGQIPTSLSLLKVTEEMDLSYNNLSGQIPKGFANLTFLHKLNLSFNDLDGEVPVNGVFSNISAISLAGNHKLCGGIFELQLEKCPKKRQTNTKLIISLVCGLVGVSLVLLLMIIYWHKRHRTRPPVSSWKDPIMHTNISYGDLHRATNGFSNANLIGVGSFGSVYNGTLDPNQPSMAVKVFNVKKRGASKSFMAECDALRNIRNRNLVKIITACSSLDYQGNEFKALVYELLPNGSLENWLHPRTENAGVDRLTLFQRLSIVIDVASALDYLHNRSDTPIIHCDLKPSNILLDQDMIAHVGDFGLSKIIVEEGVQISQNSASSTIGVRGTIGYAAPEYGIGGEVSTNGDMYSFGILLLEMFTGKRPTDEVFVDGMNLNGFVDIALPDRVMEVLDQSLISEVEQHHTPSSSSNNDPQVETRRKRIIECLVLIFRIGVTCSEESPSERMKIYAALNELFAIKKMLLEDGRYGNVQIQR